MPRLILILTILLAPSLAAAQTTIYSGAAQPHTLVSYLWRPDYIGKKPEGGHHQPLRARPSHFLDACQTAKQTAEADLQRRGWVLADRALTFKALAEEWLKTYPTTSGIGPTTRENHESVVRLLIPWFGSQPVGDRLRRLREVRDGQAQPRRLAAKPRQGPL